MRTSIRQLDLFENILPPDTPLGNYQCQVAVPTLPPAPADPLDHHKRFGVTAERHVQALEWLSDNNQEFADLEDRQAAIEETGDPAGAAKVQEQLDRIVADHLQRPAPAPPPDATKATEATEPAPLKWNELTQGRKALVADLEKHLRGKGWPYVAVDEAKKAIFTAGSVRAFDYLVYSNSGPNLLVLIVTRRPTADQVEQMRQWETIFGSDFRAAFTFRADGQWRLVSLKDLQTPDPLAHSRSMEESINQTPNLGEQQ